MRILGCSNLAEFLFVCLPLICCLAPHIYMLAVLLLQFVADNNVNESITTSYSIIVPPNNVYATAMRSWQQQPYFNGLYHNHHVVLYHYIIWCHHIILRTWCWLYAAAVCWRRSCFHALYHIYIIMQAGVLCRYTNERTSCHIVHNNGSDVAAIVRTSQVPVGINGTLK